MTYYDMGEAVRGGSGGDRVCSEAVHAYACVHRLRQLLDCLVLSAYYNNSEQEGQQ